FFSYCWQRHASRSAPRTWQKDTKIAQLPNTHNGSSGMLRSARQNPEAKQLLEGMVLSEWVAER
ncbi:hypothetical protein, partial [Roseivirga sp. UBA838]|uniref:hypothetical protein n=1 Tax=Roseivirga sp. UBA838 TaxID=1947393 RepID=UPI00257FA08E